MTSGADDKNAIVISTALDGLPCDTKELGKRIRGMIAGYHTGEATRFGVVNRANDEIEALAEMATALKLALRKMRAAPQSVELWAEKNSPVGWGGMVSTFESAVAPVLGALDQTQEYMSEHRQGPGNPASMENRDLLLAVIRRWLRDARAPDFNQRTQIILQAYGVPCPTDKRAFARAAKAGERLLNGPPPEGTWTWVKEQLAEKGQ